jgi:hypothetical protein
VLSKTSSPAGMGAISVIADGGANILLAIFMLWTVIKAVEASFKLYGKYARRESYL